MLSLIHMHTIFKEAAPRKKKSSESFLQQWPALSISLFVTGFSLLILVGLAAAGWPGSVASNCYEDYLVTPDCYCERLRGDKPGDVWLAQPINTITNLWFILVGFLIAYAADSRKFPSKEWWTDNNNLITQDKMYSIVLSLSACLLGVGSTFLHASFTTWGRQSDMIAMYFVGTFLILYPLLRDGHITKQQAMWTYGLSNIYLVYWVSNVATPDTTRKLFTTLILTSWIIEIFFVDPKWAKQNQQSRKIFFGNLLMFIVAVLQWKASESGGPLCDPETIFQGHSLWHLQSALGIGGEFLYYLGEKGTPAPKHVFVENTESIRSSHTMAESTSGAQSVGSNSMTDSPSATSYDSGSECSH